MILDAPKVMAPTTNPAIKTPSKIRGKARRNGMPNKNAAMDPVQAPVIGNGIATKSTSARSPQR